MKEGNLATVQYKSNDQITGEYKDMKLEIPLFREVGYADDKKVVATFTIREKTETEKRLDKLEKGQAVQDGAILELAGVVGGNV